MEKNRLFILFFFIIIQSVSSQKYVTFLGDTGYDGKFIICKDSIGVYLTAGVGRPVSFYNYKQKGDTLFIINGFLYYKVVFLKNRKRIKIYYKDIDNNYGYFIAYKDNLWIKFRNFLYAITHINFNRRDGL